MINLRSWADFEKYRDCKRPLIIYSSGAAGRHFLNKNKLKPVYFCDKKASVCREILSEDLDIIKVLTLEELKSYTDGTPLDVIVALTKPEDILSFLKDTENVFSQNTFLYFYHAFNYVSRKPDHFFKDVRINGEYVFHGKPNVWLFNIDKIMDNYEDIHDYDVDEHVSLLKSCFKQPESVSVDYLRKHRATFYETFANGCFMTVNENRIRRPVREDAVKVYLFGTCQMQSYQSQFENGFENVLYNKLNTIGCYDILNYSNPSMRSAYDLYRQLLEAAPKKDSIVIFSYYFIMDEIPYWVLSKQYCDSHHCRLICVPFAEVYYREVFADYEKYILKKLYPVDTADHVMKVRNLKIKQINEFAAYAARFNVDEIYFFSRDFLQSEKALFIDCRHLADWGNEAFANDLADIIEFHSEPMIAPDVIMKEKSEKFMESITYIIPDIYSILENLAKQSVPSRRAGAIVMNANPFTLGHLYLIETAARSVAQLYVFVVEEDKSQFSFKERIELVREGTRHLENITVLPSSKLIISGNTFSEYFIKDQVYQKPDVTLDLHIFGAAVSQKLNIKTRFVGAEPFDPVTRHYNEEMKRILPEYGVNVTEIERCKINGEVVSASRVRKLLLSRTFDELEALVPEITLSFLKEKYSG